MDAPVSTLERTLLKYVPPLRWRKRALQMDFRESFHDAVNVGTSPLADLIRSDCERMLHEAFPNQPDMWEKLTPKYNPGCKRVLVSDDYYPALARDNVQLETRAISNVTKSGIRCEGGEEQDYDLIVCATGFQALEFMHPIEMYGKDGRALSEVWKSGARAYNGVTVESIPNFGIMYGPNTNLGHNSIILMLEAQSRYINALIAPVVQASSEGKRLAVAVKPERVNQYNEKVQAVLKNSSFADPNCSSW